MQRLQLSCPLVNLSQFLLVQSILQGGLTGFSPFDEISAAELGFQQFTLSSEIFLSYIFFNLRLFDGVHIHYFQVRIIFLFSKHSDSFLNFRFCSFHYLSFSTFHYEHDFLCQIPFQVFVSDSQILFSFFANSLIPFIYTKL